MSTNIDFKLQNNSPVIKQEEINPTVSDDIEDIKPLESLSQRYIKDFLNVSPIKENLNDLMHLSIAQIIFNEFYAITFSLSSNRELQFKCTAEILNLFDSIRLLQNASISDVDNRKKEMCHKIETLFLLIPKTDKNKILLDSIKKILKESEIADILSPVNRFITYESSDRSLQITPSLDRSLSILVRLCVFISFRINNMKADHINSKRKHLDSIDENRNGIDLYYHLYNVLTNKFLKCSGELKRNQMKDLLHFFEDFFETFDNKIDFLLKSTNFYINKINLSVYEICSELESLKKDKNLNYDEFFKKNKYKIEELFSYLKEIRKSLIDNEELSLLAKLRSSIFYFFYTIDPEKLKKILEDSKNYTVFFRSLKKELIVCSQELDNQIKTKKIPKEYFECCKIDTVANELRSIAAGQVRYLDSICSLIETWVFIDSGKTEQLFNEAIEEKTARSTSSKHQKQLKRVEESKKVEEIEEKNDKTSDLGVITPIALEETKEEIEEKEVPVKKGPIENLHSIQDLIAVSSDKTSFSGKFTKGHFDNAQFYLSNLLTLWSRFIRASKNPLSLDAIAAYNVNLIINGSLGLEQMYSAIIAEQKKCKTLSELNTYLSHDLFDLYSNCDGPSKEDLNLLLATNKGEIYSRNVLKLIGNYHPKRHAFVKRMLESAYLLSIKDPNVNLKELLNDSIRYCREVICSLVSLRKFISIPLPQEKWDELQEQLNSFSGFFRDACKNISLTEVKQTNEYLPDIKEKLTLLSTSGSIPLTSKNNFDNLQFLLSLHQADMDSFSAKNPEEIGMIYSRVLQLNQTILEEFLYLILENHGEHPDRRDFDHHLDKLLEQTKYSLKLTSQEMKFLQTGKEVRFMTRYGTDLLKEDKGETPLAKTTKSSRNLAKKKSAEIPVKSKDSDGFTPVVNPMDKKMESKIKNIHELILLDCKILNSIFQKLTDLPEFKKDFKLK